MDPRIGEQLEAIDRLDRTRPVPQSGRRARHLDPALRPGRREVVRDELPAAEVLEDCALVLHRHGHVQVPVLARLATDPGVDRVSAAHAPRLAVGGHHAGDARDQLGRGVALI